MRRSPSDGHLAQTTMPSWSTRLHKTRFGKGASRFLRLIPNLEAAWPSALCDYPVLSKINSSRTYNTSLPIKSRAPYSPSRILQERGVRISLLNLGAKVQRGQNRLGRKKQKQILQWAVLQEGRLVAGLFRRNRSVIPPPDCSTDDHERLASI